MKGQYGTSLLICVSLSLISQSTTLARLFVMPVLPPSTLLPTEDVGLPPQQIPPASKACQPGTTVLQEKQGSLSDGLDHLLIFLRSIFFSVSRMTTGYFPGFFLFTTKADLPRVI